MEEAYCGTVGVEFTHIADLDQACVCLCACLSLYPQARTRVSICRLYVEGCTVVHGSGVR